MKKVIGQLVEIRIEGVEAVANREVEAVLELLVASDACGGIEAAGPGHEGAEAGVGDELVDRHIDAPTKTSNSKSCIRGA